MGAIRYLLEVILHSYTYLRYIVLVQIELLVISEEKLASLAVQNFGCGGWRHRSALPTPMLPDQNNHGMLYNVHASTTRPFLSVFTTNAPLYQV